MSQVNSPYSLAKIRPINELSVDQNNYLSQLERVIQQIYLRVGGTSDNTKEDSIDLNLAVMNSLSQEDSQPAPVIGDMNSVPYYSISSDRTTKGSEFIQASAACEITLNATPEDNEEVWIQPTASVTITVTGAINGGTELLIRHAYDLAHIRYSVLSSEWSVL